ncbi:MAG: SelB C-terminal domain-containing protein, partial [Planctomycetota bacterium]
DELERQASSLGSVSALLEALLVRTPDSWASVDDMALGIKRPRGETLDLLGSLAQEEKVVDLGKSKWIHAEALALSLTELREAVGTWFEENPLRARMDVRDLRARLKLDPGLIGVLLDRESGDGRIELSAGGFLSPSGRKVALDPELAALRERALVSLGESRFQPPSPDELAAGLGTTRESVDTLLRLCVDEGSVEHIGADLYLSGTVVEDARQAVTTNCQANGHLEIPELRDALGTTRKFLIPILEHFDTEGLTLRQAGRRVLRQK